MEKYGGPFVSKLISGIGDKYVKKYRSDKNIGSVSGRIGMFLKKIIDAVRLEGEKISSVCGNKICREK